MFHGLFHKVISGSTYRSQKSFRQTLLAGSFFEGGMVNGMDANFMRAIGEKYGLKLKWKRMQNNNLGLSPLDYSVKYGLP